MRARWPDALGAARLENLSTIPTNHTNGRRSLRRRRDLDSRAGTGSGAPPRAGPFRGVRGVRGPLVAALGAIAALAACAPKAAAPAAQPVGLDCRAGFEQLKARIVGQPGLVAAPKDPAEPYRFYSMADGRTSYLVTEPGAPGHPAILMQQVTAKGVVTSGCPFGDRKGYAQVAAYLDSLKTWTRK